MNDSVSTDGISSILVAVKAYSRRMDDEITIKPGDRIQIITNDEEFNDGWYVGRNLETSKEGLFPKLFTKQYTPTNDNLTKEQKTDRTISVKNTMNDIDMALEALRNSSFDLLNENNASPINLPKLQITDDMASLTDDASLNTPALEIASTMPTAKGLSLHSDNNSSLNNVSLWTPEEVTSYFLSRGFDNQIASRFEKHHVTGKILLDLELSHLKEIEINSFGTRFEIFKEIDNLRLPTIASDTSSPCVDAVKRKSQLMSPAQPDKRKSIISTNIDDIYDATKTPRSNRHRPSSIAINGDQKMQPLDQLNGTTINTENGIFESPGVAPKPPSYPSPVQPRLSPIVNRNSFIVSPKLRHNSQDYRYPSISENNASYNFPKSSLPTAEHIRSESASSFYSNQELSKNTSYRSKTSGTTATAPTSDSFNGNTMTSNASNLNENGNRNSTLLRSHRKTASGSSFVDLFNRISMLSTTDENSEGDDTIADDVYNIHGERPTSSIYGISHSRNPSGNNNKVSHSRNPSGTNNRLSHSRNPSVVNHKTNHVRTRSGVNNTVGHSRTPSEVDYKVAHSRTPSGVNGHLRKTSQVSADVKKSRRSSVLSFFSPSKNTDAMSLMKSSNYNNDLDMTPGGTKSHSHSRKSSAAVSSIRHQSLNKEAIEKGAHLSSRNTSVGTVKQKPPLQKRTTTEIPKNKGKFFSQQSSKKQTSAFQEGIRTISVSDAIRDATCSGWMSKKGSSTMGVWKTRFFTLHGNRLSYFSNSNDGKERGLIDITGHKVVPIQEDEKLISLYAASIGRGKYFFKLVPPQPGFKKGLTFTQPRVHYFAVDTKKEMRQWIAALIKASIEIDDSTPIICSYNMPTVSLNKAQEMLNDAKEELSKRDEDRELLEVDEDQMMWEEQNKKNKMLAAGFL